MYLLSNKNKNMSETFAPHHDEINQEAGRLRQSHAYWSEGLEQAEDVNNRAQELRGQIEQSDNREEDFSYQDRVFANGEIAQGQKLVQAKLHYNANMWEAQEHYRQNKDAYIDLAKLAAKAAGVELKLSNNTSESIGHGDSLNDNQEDGEKLRHGKKFEIVFMRHGQPYRPGEMPDNPEDIARLGSLTELGKEQARTSVTDEIEKVLDNGKPTTFFVLGSPSPYFINGQAFNQRSMETASVARHAIEEVIASRGLTPEQADIHDFGSEANGARPSAKLGEPDFYHVNGAKDPGAYANAVVELAKEEGSIEKYGGPGHLEPWLRSEPALEDLRKEVGAQSSPEVAERVMKFFGVLQRYANAFEKAHPGRELVFIAASHGEILRTVIQHGFQAGGEGADGKVYDMAEVMPITVENYQASTNFRGKDYKVDLPGGARKSVKVNA
jgi:hypothetical protein